MAGENQFLARVPAGGWAAFLPPGIVNRVCDFFTYGANFLPVAANGVLQQDIQIQNDSNFVILAGVASVTEAEDAGTFLVHPAWPLTVAMNDTGAGRQLQNTAAPLGNLFADQDWKLWPQPKFIRAGATLSTTLANLTSTALNVRISFLGAKVFGFSG